MAQTIAVKRPVLADMIGARGALMNIALIAGGVALTAGAAQLYIPMWPVPITGQTFAVLLVGATLGAWRAGVSMAVPSRSPHVPCRYRRDVRSGSSLVVCRFGSVGLPQYSSRHPLCWPLPVHHRGHPQDGSCWSTAPHHVEIGSANQVRLLTVRRGLRAPSFVKQLLLGAQTVKC